MPGWGNLTISANDWANKANRQQQVYEDRHNELRGNIDAIRGKLAAVDKTTNPKDYEETSKALDAANKSYQDFIDPTKNPGVFERVKHLVHAGPGAQAPKDDSGKEIPGAKKLYPSQMKQEAEKLRKALGETQAQVAAGPLSPEQQAGVTGRLNLAGIQAQIKNYDTLNPHANSPDATPEEKEARQTYINSLIQSPSKANYKPDVQPLTLSDGTTISAQWEPISKRWNYLNGEEIPSSLLAGAKITPKPVAKKGLKYEPNTGEVIDQDSQPPKRYSIADMGKKDTPPEVAQLFNDSKSMMDKKQQNALALANQRGLSFAQNRFGAFVDPNNPTQVIPVPYGEAAKRGLHLATGAQYQTMEAMLKSSTSGPIGNEIGAFSTSLQHADLLGQAALALNNGDIRLLNRLKNDFATQFSGEEAPTDFNTIAGAYTREVTKALSSGHITDAEIAANGLTIPRDASPTQISGAVNAYKNLMRSKINIRLQQIKAGMQGTPFLGVDTGAPPPQGGGGGNKHRIKIGNKLYIYNGTGDTSDLKNYTEVKQ
jgi:hypothetical protein